MNDDDLEMNVETISLIDEEGRSLLCSIEKSVDVDGAEYLLLLPIHAPIEIFVWDESEDDEEDEVLVDIDDDEIADIFDTARAVLAEQNLMLNYSAFTLTADGPLPEDDEEAVLTLNIGEGEEDEEIEEFQMLATFFHEEQEYVLCTPRDPLLLFAKRTDHQAPTLLTPEEFHEVRHQLEELLFDDMDD